MHPSLKDLFFRQSEFAAGYAPLYEQLFAIVGGWLKTGEDPLGAWLEEVSRGRLPLEVTLLLMAGLHDAVLGGHAAAGELRAYFKTVGGRRPPDRALAGSLRRAVQALRPRLTEVIQTWHAQTNETGRGTVWLLPLTRQGWPEVDLVDLGASAGLNLAADRRRFTFVNAATGQEIGRLGAAPAEQFGVQVHGYAGQWDGLSWHHDPAIVHRIGCDQNPFFLNSPADERRLLSFVWGDHPERLERLKEGITARRGVDIHLKKVVLPDDLPDFLDRLPPADRPLILYNTVIKLYFAERVAEMDRAISAWAAVQARPVMWAQWEPADEQRAETTMAWTVDLWHNGRHTRELLGWVHPHGREFAIC